MNVIPSCFILNETDTDINFINAVELDIDWESGINSADNYRSQFKINSVRFVINVEKIIAEIFNYFEGKFSREEVSNFVNREKDVFLNEEGYFAVNDYGYYGEEDINGVYIYSLNDVLGKLNNENEIL